MRLHSCASVRRGARNAAFSGLLLWAVQVGAGPQIPHDDRAIVHALNRLAFGARPGDVERIKSEGLPTWIERQLQPASLPDRDVAARLAPLATLQLDARTIAREYVAPARQERRRRQLQNTNGTTDGAAMTGPREPGMDAASRDAIERGRLVLTELTEAKLLRAVYSERQLEEVLVDFWFNHFNVFARKGQTEVYLGEYERDAIRPHVLGRFRDLLGATAKSPAMLFYLDNWLSADPNAAAPRPRRPADGSTAGAPAVQNRMPRGLNENYARELLELHTLGVDGGYTQQDVIEVARAFTGWTIGRPDQAGFRFASPMHDRGIKKVLDTTIPAGGGIEDGERVLDLLAAHPSTARHIAFKLAQRFVSDTPPEALVVRAAATFERTRGDLRAVVRTIVTSPEFFAPAARRAKVKTPFEFVASALRATGADIGSAGPLSRALAGLGMPLYLCQPPTGYDETAETWVSSGALVNRMNFALAVAGGQVRGVRLPVREGDSVDGVRSRIVRDALAGEVTPATLATIAKGATVDHAIALAIGSPEFQRQ
jgi:uncharacterized protein (DUF1800 family)